MSKPFIVNCEVFLQCHGHCSGCFLSEIERAEENTHLSKIKEPLLRLLNENKDGFTHYVIGFGRGNLLSMSDSYWNELLLLIDDCEEILGKEMVTFEISTSLIGKLDKQVDISKSLIRKNQNIYFNVVINSEITSNKFWENWNVFYQENVKERESLGFVDYTGDIVVINVNPRKLPDLQLLKSAFNNKPSPINISLFPYDGLLISQQELDKLNLWSLEMFDIFKDLDLNIKNYLNGLSSIGVGNSLEDTLSYHNETLSSYFFIDKNGQLVPGSTSIMGEVDYVRLLEKYSTNVSPQSAIIKMQKNKTCINCDYQQTCILSGAYLNMMHNEKRAVGVKGCLSGYQKIFESI